MIELQKTFKENYMKTLHDAVVSGEAVSLYKNESFEIDQTKVKKLANVYAPLHLAKKMDSNSGADFQSAIALFEAYKGISPLLASNEAFWAYLTHTELFNYTQKRWPNVFVDSVSSRYILDHWFIGGNGLFRNAVAALWWGVYLTVDENRENKYELTKVLFQNYTFRVIAFGSYTLIRHREAMIGILEFLSENPDLLYKSFEIRGQFISKYFNRLGAVKQLAYLDRGYFKNVCEQMKDKIMSVTKREQLQDESLYVYTI